MENIGHYVTGKYYDPHQCDIPRPASLDRMLDAAKRLSSGFPQVRVDLYEVAGNPVFGELTFTSSAGMDTGFSQEFQELMGSANIHAARQADATVAPGTARAPRTAEGRRQIKTAGSPEERVQQAAPAAQA